MKVIHAIVRAIDRLNEWVGTATSWLSTLLVVVVCYDVFTRYFLRKSSVAVQELEWHIFAVLFLIAAAYTLKQDSHVRVDVFYTLMSPRGQAWINMLGGIIFLIPFCILILWTSKNFISMSWAVREISPDPGGLPYRYALKAMIPIGFSLILLQGIALTLRSFCTVIGRPMEDSDQQVKEQQHA
ncbi:MAG: TRAP transporter small permease subunit [Desulfuromonadales bacterium]|nr:TRAP transporter small permease subunit [Desulfuromonadales bacterium]